MNWLPTESTPVLDAALAYASHGLRVIPVWGVHADGRCSCGRSPCQAPGKHPVERAWQTRATCDQDAVRDAFRGRAVANVGLAMGGPERYVAVDIDGPQGRESWAAIEQRHGPTPRTLTSRSGRPDGGEHRIYRVPAALDIRRLGNRSGFRWDGIDTRIDGGQIVAPPSRHASGALYEWVDGPSVADMPEWLYLELAAPEPSRRLAPVDPVARPAGGSPYVARAVERALSDIAARPKGERNHVLFAKATTVLEYVLGDNGDVDGTKARLVEAGIASGLSPREARDTVRNAWTKAQASGGRAVPVRPVVTAPSADVRAGEGGGQGGGGGQGDGGSGGGQGGGADPDAWRAGLALTAKGGVRATLANVALILRHDGQFAGRLSYDSMRAAPMLDGAHLTDTQAIEIRIALERSSHQVAATKELVRDAILVVASEDSVHPVREYLSGLAWDGEPRIDRVCNEVLGMASPSPIDLRMLRAWFVGAVKRPHEPGCKFDGVLVLAGRQGAKKSSFFRVLGGGWFSDSYVDIRSKDGAMSVHASWIFEWPEIERVTTRTSSAEVKSFLTSSVDFFRPPYGTAISEHRRSSVIVGTTNRPFLDDETGSRRFWPLRAGENIDLDLLAEWRDQLWAEAVAAYRAGELSWLTAEEEAARDAEASEHAVDDPLRERIAIWLETSPHADHGVTVGEVLSGALGLEVGRVPRSEETRAGKALRALGWSPRQARRHGARVRIYRRDP